MSEAELDGSRRDAVIKFLEARARMLKNAVKVMDGETGKHTGNESRLASEARAISFDRAEGYETEGARIAKERAQQKLTYHLHGILESARTFRFETTLVRHTLIVQFVVIYTADYLIFGAPGRYPCS